MKTLRQIWHIFKRVGQFVGDWVARIVLTVFYLTVFVPFGLGMRLLKDPLEIKAGYRGRWLERVTHDLTLDDARRLS